MPSEKSDKVQIAELKTQVSGLETKLKNRTTAIEKNLIQNSFRGIAGKYAVSEEILRDIFKDKIQVVEDSGTFALKVKTEGGLLDFENGIEDLILSRKDAHSFVKPKPTGPQLSERERLENHLGQLQKRMKIGDVHHDDLQMTIQIKNRLASLPAEGKKDLRNSFADPRIERLQKQLVETLDVGERIALKNKIHDLSKS